MHPRIASVYTQLFFRDAWFINLTAGSGAVLSALVAFLVWQREVIYKPGENIALHYKVFFGIDFLAEWYYIIAVPVFGLAVLALNYTLARRAFTQSKQVSYLLVVTALMVQVILLWATYLIVRINIF